MDHADKMTPAWKQFQNNPEPVYWYNPDGSFAVFQVARAILTAGEMIANAIAGRDTELLRRLSDDVAKLKAAQGEIKQ